MSFDSSIQIGGGNDQTTSNSRFFDSSFDYRSLLPQGNNNSSGGGLQQPLGPNHYDVETTSTNYQQGSGSGFFGRFFPSNQNYNNLSSSSSAAASSISLSSSTELCWGYLPEMSWRERVIGCVTCMVCGYLLSMGSIFRIKDLLFGNPIPLVVNSTIGNFIALLGSCFLSGPTNQMNRMFTSKRKVATLMYLSSLLATIIVICIPLPGPKGLVLLVLLLSQYVSITWYCLSYVPMGQEIVAGYFQRLINNNMDS